MVWEKRGQEETKQEEGVLKGRKQKKCSQKEQCLKIQNKNWAEGKKP